MQQKILAIDDKIDNLISLNAFLKNLMPDITVVTARSGMEGIEKAKTERPDAILLDVKMPEMDGFETCRRLMADESTKRIPVIMITAIKTDPQSRIKGLDVGANTFLAKPIDEYELVSQIKVALRLKKAEDELRKDRDSLEKIVAERTAELRESEQQLNLILQTVPALIWQKNLEGAYVLVNKSYCQTVGFSEEQINGKTDYDLYPEEIADQYTSYDQEVIKTGKSQFGIEERHLKSTGETGWSRTDKLPFFDANGNIAGTIGFALDITESKASEAEREKLQAQFTQSQKMESIGRLAGGVAHDLNNMLGVIIGNTEIVMDRVDSEELLDDLREVMKAAERSANLTRQLLAFARKQTISPKVIDLNVALNDMLKMLERIIGEDIELKWQPKDGLWPIKVDPSQVDQILANLCVNARDAINGVGKLTIKTENIILDRKWCSNYPGAVAGEYVLLSVGDNGCGMDRKTLENIFEPFFTTKDVGKGTGLGLSTVYGIVKQNNGFIDVQSESGQGAIFNIFLPRYIDKNQQMQNKLPTEQKTGCINSETILLVEDEPSILKLTKMMLEKQGYTVLAAGRPGEAISIAQKHHGKIHLLMTDVIMPEMNGRALTKNIMSIYPDIKRLFMSGYTADIIAHHGVLDAGVHFIQKPFSKQELFSKVRETLNNG